MVFKYLKVVALGVVLGFLIVGVWNANSWLAVGLGLTAGVFTFLFILLILFTPSDYFAPRNKGDRPAIPNRPIPYKREPLYKPSVRVREFYPEEGTIEDDEEAFNNET